MGRSAGGVPLILAAPSLLSAVLFVLLQKCVNCGTDFATLGHRMPQLLPDSEHAPVKIWRDTCGVSSHGSQA